tara:strand:- start:1 stop:168 length:168 start_codon:yes stop_codon:yes gene_type:complete
METNSQDTKREWLIRVWYRGEMELRKEFTIRTTEKRLQKFIIPKKYRATYEIANT